MLPVAIALVFAFVLFVIFANIIFRFFPSTQVSVMKFVYKNRANQQESENEHYEMKDVTNSIKTVNKD